MPPKPIACDHELLRLSVDDRLNEQQEESLARHLSECESCQGELDRSAGRQTGRIDAAFRARPTRRQLTTSRTNSLAADSP